MSKLAIFWFRRDLRLEDNAGLYHALKSGLPLQPIFIFDREILDKLEDKKDARVHFIHRVITELDAQLKALGSCLRVYYGSPSTIWPEILKEFDVAKVFTNHDYEPYALERDGLTRSLVEKAGASFHTFKDQVIFEKDEVVKDDCKPYTVFTPYSRRWKAALKPFFLKSYPTKKYFEAFHTAKPTKIPSLADMGFEPSEIDIPPTDWKAEVIKKYSEQRDFPAVPGTSRLGVHLRFGTISIRQLAREAGALNETYLNELIWRDFYHMILWHFPRVGKGLAFKPDYDQIQWLNDEAAFEKWCKGETGYPIVDAGMRELNATGYMHNRVRMIVASFLTKHLLIDWRWGEAYFAQKLLDFDLAANNGGWQWAAGSGCDAAPYFRVFNPQLQTQKFDPQLKYIRKWVPELDSFNYPRPIVQHELARKRCLETYAAVLKKD
ncbi:MULTISPECIES: cryptochrome/photolyase family protein [unclassified Paraflavitalea]|uniref:cryptochrome/photolyase family protein n=1 Tax=unclassified Paraflavitalea TaxID=2798305 RepID=UPI003D335023